MIKQALKADTTLLSELAAEFWSSHTADELKREFDNLLSTETNACFIVYCGGSAVGFAHCSLRFDYVEGSDSSPTGYLEGIYIRQKHRGKGCAKKLLRECEKWAAEKGCRKFASDCEFENSESITFHNKAGFKETNRIVCFIKEL